MAEDSLPPSTPKIIGRAEAIAAGLKQYFTGKACKNGHVAERHVSGTCRKCEAARKAREYRTDPAKKAARIKSRYDWLAKNPERERENRKAWRAANRWREAPGEAAWRKANAEKRRAYQANRKAKQKAAEGSHTAEDVARLLEQQRWRCACCRRSVRRARHVDHIIPLARGGGNAASNLQILCPPCNVRKGTLLMEQFMRSKGALL